MARTDEGLVAGVIEIDGNIDLGPFIDVASELVTELCEPLGYTEHRLELIETWLAAHFYAIRDRETRIAQEWIGQAVGTQYRGKVDLGLNQTEWGQQVMLLDTKLGLAKLQQGTQGNALTITPTMIWLGDTSTTIGGADLERLEAEGDAGG